MNWPGAFMVVGVSLAWALCMWGIAWATRATTPTISEANKLAASAKRIKEEKYTWQNCPVLECRIKTPHSHTQAFLDRLRGK